MLGEDDQIVRDEEMARRLQQEELRQLLPFRHRHNENRDIVAPLLNRNAEGVQGNQNQVRRNFVESIRETENDSARVLLVRVTINLIEVIATAAIIAASREEYCSRPLRWWVLAFSARNFISGPLHIYIFRALRSNNPNVEKAIQFLKWLNILTFLWFLVGQSFLFTGQPCKQTAPTLWIYCLIIVILVYISLSLPFLILLAVCICFPCVLLIFRLLSEPQGADDAFIKKLPKRTFSPEPLETDEEPLACSICMSEYEEGDELRILPCKHEFHVTCVDRWLPLKKMCPLCRHDITQPPPVDDRQIDEGTTTAQVQDPQGEDQLEQA